VIAERIQTYPLQHPNATAEPVLRARPTLLAGDLRWVKPSIFGNQYELRSANRCVATLSIRGFFRPTGHGEGIGGCWAFGPLQPEAGTIAVRSDASYGEVGVFDIGHSSDGGMLRTSDGRALVLSSDFWKGCAEFQTPLGEPLIRFHFRGLFRPSAEVEILGEGKYLGELPWILMLGWCLIVGYL
jgi:hypothetical protein